MTILVGTVGTANNNDDDDDEILKFIPFERNPFIRSHRQNNILILYMYVRPKFCITSSFELDNPSIVAMALISRSNKDTQMKSNLKIKM